MSKIPDDLLDAAMTAYTDAIDLDVTTKHLMTKVLEAVLPLIAAAEREECAKIAEQFRDIYQKDAFDEGCDATAVAVTSAIRRRGVPCA